MIIKLPLVLKKLFLKIKSIQDIIAIHLIPNRKQFPQNNSRSGTFIISQAL